MAKSKEIVAARGLRKKGYSIKDIAKELEVSKSSVSVWCSDIILSVAQIKKLHVKMVRGGYEGRMKGALSQKNRKLQKIEQYIEKGRKEIVALKKRELLIAGLALYWGEGSKRDPRVRFYNSDQLIVKFAMRWFREALHIPNERFAMHVAINEIHKERLREVDRYWSNITGVSVKQFRKPILIKTENKKVYENHFQHYGTLCIRIAKSSELFYEIMGLMKALGEAA
ncbi:MAG: hypothetical protein WAV73_01880 [Candidatus Moraniibacteriota bacterium]